MMDRIYKCSIFSLGLFLITILFSCSAYKKVNYFQDLDRSKEINQTITNYSPVTIQTGDILGVTVSSLNPAASEPFNVNMSLSTGSSGSDAGNSVLGYLVDQKGEIQLPLVPSIKVSGLTTSEAQAILKKAVLPYLKEPVVNVRLLNFKFSLIGDVNGPGVHTVRNERITILEALGLSGDLAITAKRKNILLIREIDGKRQFINIDLTSSKLFQSPYYYLKNNDVLYVEADKVKYAALSPFTRNLSLVLSVISLVGIAYQLTKL